MSNLHRGELHLYFVGDNRDHMILSWSLDDIGGADYGHTSIPSASDADMWSIVAQLGCHRAEPDNSVLWREGVYRDRGYVQVCCYPKQHAPDNVVDLRIRMILTTAREYERELTQAQQQILETWRQNAFPSQQPGPVILHPARGKQDGSQSTVV